MATVINPNTPKLQSSFAPVAKYYGVQVVACPPGRGNRKGVVEKHIHYMTQRWWRTVSASSLAQAQDDLDWFCATTGDHRPRGEETVAVTADTERLLELPATAYPAVTEDTENPLRRKGSAARPGSQASSPRGQDTWENPHHTLTIALIVESFATWAATHDSTEFSEEDSLLAAPYDRIHASPRGPRRRVRLRIPPFRSHRRAPAWDRRHP